jgi:putative proteasome-type protease
MVSMDSTLRSNLTVGPPLELLIYKANSLTSGEHIVFEEDDEYLRLLRASWHESLQRAFAALPRLSSPAQHGPVRLVDPLGD